MYCVIPFMMSLSGKVKSLGKENIPMVVKKLGKGEVLTLKEFLFFWNCYVKVVAVDTYLFRFVKTCRSICHK